MDLIITVSSLAVRRKVRIAVQRVPGKSKRGPIPASIEMMSCNRVEKSNFLFLEKSVPGCIEKSSGWEAILEMICRREFLTCAANDIRDLLVIEQMICF